VHQECTKKWLRRAGVGWGVAPKRFAGNVKTKHLRPFRWSRRVEQLLPAFPHLFAATSRNRDLCLRADRRDGRSPQFVPFQHVNAIRVQDGGEPVRDQYRDGVAAHGHTPNGLADLSLPLSKNQATKSLRRTPAIAAGAEAGARDREPLLFSSRNLHPAFANLRVEPVIGSQEQTFDSGLT